MNIAYPYNVLISVFASSEDLDKYVNRDDKEELQRQIEGLLGEFPKAQRRMFLLNMKEGIPIAKIAEQENIDYDDVYFEIGRTMRYLRHPSRSKLLIKYL